MKPILKWAGGKRWLLKHLQPVWQPFSSCRLVEPFCGGLAVTLGLLPKRALLSDINPYPISLYQYAQRGLCIDLEMKNDKAYYYACRDRFNHLIAESQGHSKEAVELFYYLNRTGYNGLCRFNKKGFFNVPFGRYKKIPYQNDFSDYQALLKPWSFYHQDFADIERQADDFIYADPPYDVPFTQYSSHVFDWAEQERLARWLAGHQGPVITSNQATPRILDLYQDLGFEIQCLPAPRRISCTGDRKPALEMLASKNI